ncbi:unnamed protein product, partial [Adineta ricciae]
MSTNGTNGTDSSSSTGEVVLWKAVVFLLFVALLLIVSVVLILYFEKLCCFARYRFLKHFLRKITRTKRSAPTSMITQPGLAAPVDKPKEEKLNLPEVQDHLWIAGQREHIENFEASDVLFVGDS